MTGLFSDIDQLNNFVIFDFETTGLDVNNDEIAEIGIAPYKSSMDNMFHCFLKTSTKMSETARAINGITDTQIAMGKKYQDTIPSLYSKYINHIWVAHNCWAFDSLFLLKQSPELFSEIKFFDSRVFAKDVLPGLEKHNLIYLASIFGINHGENHHADIDVLYLSEVLEVLLRINNGKLPLKDYTKTGKELYKKLSNG